MTTTTTTATTPTTTIPDRGYDLDPRSRPGVPMERDPRPLEGAHQLPPVHGTAQPPRGVSGVMRRFAYRMPEHEARRWTLLLLADRVDAIEHGAWGLRAVLAVVGLGAAVAAGLQLRALRK